MEEIDELIHALTAAVNELKQGIMQYNNEMQHVDPEAQYQMQEKIKRMHQIALKLGLGIEGLRELKHFTQEQLGH